MNISSARVAAFEILKRIETEEAFSSHLLPEYESGLSVRDAALTHELVLGTLRKQLFLDHQIAIHSKSKKLDVEVRIALRMGLYQLLFLDRIPTHSAINESVELVKYARKRSAAGFANAVLRKLANSTPNVSFDDDLERLSVNSSHPRWLVEKWIEEIGFEGTEKLATANNQIPRLSFRLTTNGLARAADLSLYERSLRTAGCFYSTGLDYSLRELAAAGDIYFQDEGSQVIANAVNLPEGGRFLDVCSAPGGKATSLATRMPEARIFAGDVTARRVETLGRLSEIQGAELLISRYDAASGPMPFADSTFDSVLVDAPCSGTGTIRHNPEIRYRVTAEDLVRLPNLQQKLLSNSAKVVRPGGQLIYTTCSLEKEEGERVVDTFLSAHEDFERVVPNVPREFLLDDGSARTWPQRDTLDGFFISTLKRRQSH